MRRKQKGKEIKKEKSVRKRKKIKNERKMGKTKKREEEDRLCGLAVTVPVYKSRGPGFDSRRYKIF
jgi:hypothetical protein